MKLNCWSLCVYLFTFLSAFSWHVSPRLFTVTSPVSASLKDKLQQCSKKLMFGCSVFLLLCGRSNFCVCCSPGQKCLISSVNSVNTSVSCFRYKWLIYTHFMFHFEGYLTFIPRQMDVDDRFYRTAGHRPGLLKISVHMRSFCPQDQAGGEQTELWFRASVLKGHRALLSDFWNKTLYTYI